MKFEIIDNEYNPTALKLKGYKFKENAERFCNEAVAKAHTSYYVAHFENWLSNELDEFMRRNARCYFGSGKRIKGG